MKHIIFAGCSFSDDGRKDDNFDDTPYKKNMSLLDLRFPVTIKMHQLLAFDLSTQNIGDIKIHTIARGSYGNHVIFKKLKDKIEEIETKYENNQIFAVIQLSAFARHGLKNTTEWFQTSDYPYDYPLKELNLLDIDEVKFFYNIHLDNIIKMNEYVENKNVKSYFYFGWANIFKLDIELYGLHSKIEKIKKFVNFYQYKESYDEINNFCSGKKITNNKIKNKLFKEIYVFPPDDFGGLTEYSRDILDLGERYHLIFDPHPSSKAYFIYYTNILKKWFVENSVIEDKEFDNSYRNLLQICFDFEYDRFMSTLKTNNTIFAEIDILSFNLVKTEKYLDKEYCKNKFIQLSKSLNKLI